MYEDILRVILLSDDPKRFESHLKNILSADVDFLREYVKTNYDELLPEMATFLAKYLTHEPELIDKLRLRASQSPSEALSFAINIDGAGHDVTRLGAILDPKTAFTYAARLDGHLHPIFRRFLDSLPEGSTWRAKFEIEFGNIL